MYLKMLSLFCDDCKRGLLFPLAHRVVPKDIGKYAIGHVSCITEDVAADVIGIYDDEAAECRSLLVGQSAFDLKPDRERGLFGILGSELG